MTIMTIVIGRVAGIMAVSFSVRLPPALRGVNGIRITHIVIRRAAGATTRKPLVGCRRSASGRIMAGAIQWVAGIMGPKQVVLTIRVRVVRGILIGHIVTRRVAGTIIPRRIVTPGIRATAASASGTLEATTAMR